MCAATVFGAMYGSTAICRLVAPVATGPAIGCRLQSPAGEHNAGRRLDRVSGRVFCLITAPSKEAGLRIHERAGHPSTEIYEVSIEV